MANIKENTIENIEEPEKIYIHNYYEHNKSEILNDKNNFLNFINIYNQDESLDDILNEILQIKPMYLEHILTQIDNDSSNYINIAINRDPLALQFVPKNIDNYDNYCKDAIDKNIEALQFADNLKNDLLFIMEKSKKESEILIYAADHIKNDGYFKDKLNDFLNCDNKDSNFINTLGTCWMVSIFTIFLFADLTRNNIQNKLILTEDYISLLTKSKDLLKYLIPFGFNEKNEIIPVYNYLLIKFIVTLKEELKSKIIKAEQKQLNPISQSDNNIQNIQEYNKEEKEKEKEKKKMIQKK